MAERALGRQEALAQIIETQPGSESAARAHYEIGGLQLARGSVEAATAAYRQVPTTWPRWHARACLAIARIYDRQLQDVDAAAREYRKVIRVHPECFASAEAYARMGELYQALGDAVSAENMRECAVKSYERHLHSDDLDERELALSRYVTTCRQLERWDEAIDALVKSRRAATRLRDTPRRVELDRQLGMLYLERQQFGNALIRFRACLQHARRRGDLDTYVSLCESAARCLRENADSVGLRRTYGSLLDFVGRSAGRRAEVLKDPRLAPVLVRAYLALGKVGQARQVHSRLRRTKSVQGREVLAAVEAEMSAVAQ